MTKPLFIDKRIYQYIDPGLYKELEVYHRVDQYFWGGCTYISSPRYGTSDVWNFSSNQHMFESPDLKIKSSQTFADITDSRAKEFASLVENSGKRLVLHWSGGIDSTAMVTAVLKNFPKYLLSQIDICMNECSYLENPSFYHRAIEKNNLNCINNYMFDSSTLSRTSSESIVTDGEPADKLWGVRIGLLYLHRYGEESFTSTLEQGRHQFIEHLGNYMSNHQAEFYWHRVLENIRENQAPVTNIGELFWWINFNYYWLGHNVQWYGRHQIKDSQAWLNYQENYRPWYNSAEYQRWSFSRISEDPVNITNIKDFKKPAKQYIYDFINDDYFFHFKAKTVAGLRGPSKSDALVILDDGSAITDPAQIETFVQQHCLVKA